MAQTDSHKGVCAKKQSNGAPKCRGGISLETNIEY